MSSPGGFPYTDAQRRWWFATHPQIEQARQKINDGDRSDSAIDALYKASQKKKDTEDELTVATGWEPVAGGKPWAVRLQSGKLLKRFASLELMQKFLANESAVRRAVRDAQ